MMRSVWKDLGVGVVGGVVSGVIAGVIVVLLGSLLLDDLVEKLKVEPPSCENPRGLRVLPSAKLKVSGDWYGQELGDDLFAPDRLKDGKLGSLWVPRPDRPGDNLSRPFEVAGGGGTLTISFVGEVRRNVRLVCVVNGLASEPTRYKNWGRVREVALHSAGPDEKRTSVLTSLGDDVFQNAQEVAVAPGPTDRLRLSVLSSYPGQTVFSNDGDLCEKDTESSGGWEVAYHPGCLHGPTRRSGLAVVRVRR